MIQGVGFDLGETLVSYNSPLDWSSRYAGALTAVAAACQVEVGDEQLNAAIDILQRYNTRRHPRAQEVKWDAIAVEVLAALGANPERQLETATEEFFLFFQRTIRPYPDTLPTLHALQARGVSVGILTDVPYGMPRRLVRRDLHVCGILPLISMWLTSVDIGWRKPDPRGLQTLAKQLGVKTTEMLYVGNEEKDVVGANAAGMQSVLVDREARRPDWPFARIIGSLPDLIGLLDSDPALHLRSRAE